MNLCLFMVVAPHCRGSAPASVGVAPEVAQAVVAAKTERTILQAINKEGGR